MSFPAPPSRLSALVDHVAHATRVAGENTVRLTPDAVRVAVRLSAEQGDRSTSADVTGSQA